MMTTKDEQINVLKAVEAVLKAQTGAHRGKERKQDSRPHVTVSTEQRPTRDAA